MEKFGPLNLLDPLPDFRVFLEQVMPQALNATERAQMQSLLRIFASVASDLRVESMLYYGSLLGVARFRDMLPWDDDLDLAINVKHASRVNQSLLQHVRAQLLRVWYS